jgi:MFS family permease
MAISPKRDTGGDRDPLTVAMPRSWVLVLLQVLVVSPMIGLAGQDPAFDEVYLWGFTRYWVFYAYGFALLPAALMACVLVDVHGPRRVMRAWLLVFAAGMALTGAASLLDGIGGGFVLLAGQTIAGLGPASFR